MLSPHLESLPEPQQRLWPELKDTPKTFVLYGGTAIALYLGHRQSEDFDFFASQPFNPLLTLKALTFFGDGDLHRVPGDVRQRLAAAVKGVDLEHIPALRAQRGLAPGGLER